MSHPGPASAWAGAEEVLASRSSPASPSRSLLFWGSLAQRVKDLGLGAGLGVVREGPGRSVLHPPFSGLTPSPLPAALTPPLHPHPP